MGLVFGKTQERAGLVDAPETVPNSQSCESGMPLVTVALPVYNAGRFLRPAVKSILMQTYPNWELLLIDDASADDSMASIEDLRDQRIKIIRNSSNRGLAVRLNDAIDLGRGEYFARMDQDDIAYPERFAKQVDALRRHPDLDLMGTRALAITSDDEPMGFMAVREGHEELCARSWLGFYIGHSTWMGKMDWFRKFRYRVPSPYFCEDQELLLRSHRESRFHVLAETLNAYRIRSHIVLRKALRTRASMLKFQSRHFARAGQAQKILLSFGAFLARAVLDTATAALGSRGLYKVRFSVPVSVEEIERWLEIRRALER